MRVKMTKLAAGPSGTFLIGVEYELPDEQALRFIAAGSAEPVRKKAREMATAEPAQERAVALAEKPKSRRRRKPKPPVEE